MNVFNDEYAESISCSFHIFMRLTCTSTYLLHGMILEEEEKNPRR